MVQNESVTTDFRTFQPSRPSSSAYKTTLFLQFFGLYEVDKGLHQLHAEAKAYVAEVFYNQLSVIDSVTYIRTYVRMYVLIKINSMATGHRVGSHPTL